MAKQKPADRIRVIVKNPGEAPEEREVPNTLEALQALVGGYIEAVPLARDAVILVNEEGKLRGMAPNVMYFDEVLVGPVVLVGVRGEEFVDVPPAAMIMARSRLFREVTPDA